MTLDKKEVLNLFWKSGEGIEFKIGELCRKSGKYYFKYEVESVKEALEQGFELLTSFPRLDSEYFREELFRIFVERIPNKNRKEYNNNITENDEFIALKETKGVINKDSLFFKEFYYSENQELDEEDKLLETDKKNNN